MAKVRKFFDKLITEPSKYGTKTKVEGPNYNPYIDKLLSRQLQQSLNQKKAKKKNHLYNNLHNGLIESHNGDGHKDVDQELLTTSSKPYSSLKLASPPISPVHSLRQSFFANTNKTQVNNSASEVKSNTITADHPHQLDSISSLELLPIGSASSITLSFNLPTIAQHDAFYSLVKIDKFKFSQRGTLLNFKTRHGNGLDIYVCDENGRKIRKRRSRRKRRGVRRRKSLTSCSLLEGEDGEGEGEGVGHGSDKVVDCVGVVCKTGGGARDDVSFVSIATTATTATTMTASINGAAASDAVRPLATESDQKGRSPATTKPVNISIPTEMTNTSLSANGKTKTKTKTKTPSTPTAPATPYGSPARFGSQFDPCFNVNDFKVKIIPDMASYQPSFLHKRNSMRTLESRVATPNTITNTTNTTNNSNGTKLPTGSSPSAASSFVEDIKSTTASFHHQEVEFGKKFTCVVEEGLKSSSLSAHASIRDIKTELNDGKPRGGSGSRVAYEIDGSDLHLLSLMQLLNYAIDCNEVREENAPLLGKQVANDAGDSRTGDVEYSEGATELTLSFGGDGGESQNLSVGANTPSQEQLEKNDHKWIFQVKDRLHYYYNANLTKLRRIKRHHQKSKAGEQDEATEKAKAIAFNHAELPSANVATPTTSNSTLNLQSGLYSHENRRSLKINVVEKEGNKMMKLATAVDELNLHSTSSMQHHHNVDSDGFYVGDETEKEDDLTGAIYFIKNDKDDEVQSSRKEINATATTSSSSIRMSKLLCHHRQQLQRLFKFAPLLLTKASNRVETKEGEEEEEDDDDNDDASNNARASIGLLKGSNLQNVLKHGSSSSKTISNTTTTVQLSHNQTPLIELHSPGDAEEESSSNDGDDEQSFHGYVESDVASSVLSIHICESVY